MKPMLAERELAGWDLARFVRDPFWALDQKGDGERRLVVAGKGELLSLNRDGIPASTRLSPAIAAELNRFRGLTVPIVFDGELIGDTFWLFDLPIAPGLTVNDEYRVRRTALNSIVATLDSPVVRILPVAWDEDAKQRLVDAVVEAGGEGFVAKHIQSIYEPGLRGRRWVKVKLTKDVDCVVTAISPTGKENMVVVMYDADGKEVEVGEVTRLAGDGAKVKVGDVIAVKLLYATVDNRLFQPTLPRIRTDKRPEECTIDQLDTVRVNKEIVRL